MSVLTTEVTKSNKIYSSNVLFRCLHQVIRPNLDSQGSSPLSDKSFLKRIQKLGESSNISNCYECSFDEENNKKCWKYKQVRVYGFNVEENKGVRYKKTTREIYEDSIRGRLTEHLNIFLPSQTRNVKANDKGEEDIVYCPRLDEEVQVGRVCSCFHKFDRGLKIQGDSNITYKPEKKCKFLNRVLVNKGYLEGVVCEFDLKK